MVFCPLELWIPKFYLEDKDGKTVFRSSCWTWEITFTGWGGKVSHSELSFCSNFKKSQHRQNLAQNNPCFPSQQGFVICMLLTPWSQWGFQRWDVNVLTLRLLLHLLNDRIWNTYLTCPALILLLETFSTLLQSKHRELSDIGGITLILLILAFRGERSLCNDKNELSPRKPDMLELN